MNTSNKKTVTNLLREKYMAAQLTKAAIEKKHPTLDDIAGIDYLKRDILHKMYIPLFHPEKYQELGAEPPKSLLIRGVDGVGKSFLVSCFCQQYRIPLVTGYVDEPKDIRELFSRARSSDRSVILIKNLDTILSKPELVFQMNESVRAMNFSSLVIFSHRNLLTDSINYESEIFIKIPTVQGRKELLDSLIKPLRTSPIDTLAIAQHTPGFVQESLVKLVSMSVTATIERVERAVARGQNPSLLIEAGIVMEDFLSAIRSWKNLEQTFTFEDIGALGRVKEELTMSILLPARFPDRFTAFGITKPSGVLLYGPPGCGKTLIAKAVSNMSFCNFLSIKGPELITKYVGDSEKHLRDLFQKAKNLSPCVLFFDEIDSLCSRRGKNEFGNRIVNQILTLLDGMEDRGEVYLIGATNRIKSIDPALMRPGRFDKIIEVPLPAREEAIEIFHKCLSSIPYIPFDIAALDLSGLSGADIAGVVKEAAILCLKENFDCTADTSLKVDDKYFMQALDKLRKMKRSRSKLKSEAAE